MKVFQAALRFVTHMQHGFIGSEHLLWALAADRGPAGRALRRSGLDQKLLEEYLHQYDFDAKAEGSFQAVQVSEEAEQVLHLAEGRSHDRGHRQVERRICSGLFWTQETVLLISLLHRWKLIRRISGEILVTDRHLCL